VAINPAAQAGDESRDNFSLNLDLPKYAKREVRTGFLTGNWIPGRLSAARSIVLTLAITVEMARTCRSKI
jgi:hypothetical protein